MVGEPTYTTIGRRALLGSLPLDALGLAATRVRAADGMLIVGSADAPASSVEAMQRLRRDMEETTRGRYAFTLDHEGPADDKAALGQVRSGEATLGWVRVAELTPEIATLSVPFLFREQKKLMGLLDRTLAAGAGCPAHRRA